MASIGYFSKIVKENHKKWMKLEDKIKKIKFKHAKTGENIEYRNQLNSYNDELAKTSFILVIFTTIAVEAYIYDYAARHLGDIFVKNHLDKLDTLSKWVIIPELITGKVLSPQQDWQGKLKRLIKARNSITHYKSWDINNNSLVDIEEKLEKFANEVRQSAQQSVGLLKLLADKISEIDPEEAPWVQSYLA